MAKEEFNLEMEYKSKELDMDKELLNLKMKLAQKIIKNNGTKMMEKQKKNEEK